MSRAVSGDDEAVGYRIHLREPVLDEVRRNLASELDAAIADLLAPDGPDAEAIHDARKRIKKSRSLLRLARAQLGPGVVTVAQSDLREASQSISAQRDADARVETVDRLVAATPAEGARAALDRLHRICTDAAAAQRAGGSLDRATVHAVAHRLQRTRDWLVLVAGQADGWDALEPGLRRQYARGRRRFAALGDAPTDEELHEWRKRAKDLWYHERLLRRLWRKAQRPYVDAASDLADLLGDDHDLALLTEFVANRSELDASDRAVLAAAISAQRAALQASARAIGAYLYADAPDAWAARHRAWWEVSKQASRAGTA